MMPIENIDLARMRRCADTITAINASFISTAQMVFGFTPAEPFLWL
jgi:hypothetical protein